MLAEIEDAVMEEDTEKASSVPVEAELYDPAHLGLGDTDSSLSSTEFGPEPSDDLSFTESTHTRTRCAPKMDLTESHRRSLQRQVQRELLIRRRCRASPEEVRKIDRKLRRLEAKFLREDRRQRSADDMAFLTSRSRLHSNRASVNQLDIQDSESDDDIWDMEYPKGWSPANQAKMQRIHHTRNRHPHRSVSVSPAIHSDPEPHRDWWPPTSVVDECDLKDWNTCPEGYDYVDAERTRALLMCDERADNLQTYSEHLYGTHHSLTSRLFGADDEADDMTEGEEDEDGATDQSSGTSDGDDEDVDPEEDLTGECWNPLREFM